MRRELGLAGIMLAIAFGAVVLRYVPATPAAPEAIYCDDGRTYAVSPPLRCPEGPVPPRKKRV